MISHGLRPGNRALDHVLAHYPLGSQRSHLTESIPTFASLLRSQAQEIAHALYQDTGLTSRLFSKLSGRYRLLADCIIDLMLVPCFAEVVRYCNDPKLASLFVDAILYEVTGCEAGTPTESEILDKGTQKVRGLSKYMLGRQHLKVADVEGWMFGKEYSALLTGRPKDFAYITAVHPTTLLIRGIGKWAADYCLYGTLPSETDKKALDSLVDASQKRLGQIIESFNPSPKMPGSETRSKERTMFKTREITCTNPDCGKPVYYLPEPERAGGGYVRCLNCGRELHGRMTRL